MSDHFHPWLDQSDDMPVAGHAGFAWSVLGMIAGRTSHIRLGTGVTCPTVRYHPTIIAQAAATMVQRAGAEAGMDGLRSRRRHSLRTECALMASSVRTGRQPSANTAVSARRIV